LDAIDYLLRGQWRLLAAQMMARQRGRARQTGETSSGKLHDAQ